MKDIRPIAIPGIHEKFLKFFLDNVEKNAEVLDAGAGHGALSYQLNRAGYKVIALDFNNSLFECEDIPFVEADLSRHLPFENNSFDVVIAVEVWEHINGHPNFLSEVYRILKPKGKLFITTPNILSLKSRMRFLFTGFFYSFKPLDLNKTDGLQHVSSFTYDQIIWLAGQYHFQLEKFSVDKKQNSSMILLFLYPIIWLYCRRKNISSFHNSFLLLTGRVMFLYFKKIA